MSAEDDPYPDHRPNVGVVLFNRDGRVWLGRRAGFSGEHCWQFPQGGVDPGEALEFAARRELLEETGVKSAVVLGRTEDWMAYDFPPGLKGPKAARGWKGQKQVWFAFLFTGEELEIDLEQHEEVEFDAWRWGALDEVEDLAVPFKREVYAQVVAAFRRYALPA